MVPVDELRWFTISIITILISAIVVMRLMANIFVVSNRSVMINVLVWLILSPVIIGTIFDIVVCSMRVLRMLSRRRLFSTRFFFNHIFNLVRPSRDWWHYSVNRRQFILYRAIRWPIIRILPLPSNIYPSFTSHIPLAHCILIVTSCRYWNLVGWRLVALLGVYKI